MQQPQTVVAVLQEPIGPIGAKGIGILFVILTAAIFLHLGLDSWEFKLAVAIAATAAIAVYYYFQKPKILMVGDEGVTLAVGDREVGHVDWPHLAEVRLLKPGGNIILKQRNGRCLVLPSPEHSALPALNEMAERLSPKVEIAAGTWQGPLPPEKRCMQMRTTARFIHRSAIATMVLTPAILELISRTGLLGELVLAIGVGLAAGAYLTMKWVQRREEAAEILAHQHRHLREEHLELPPPRPTVYELRQRGSFGSRLRNIPSDTDLVYPRLTQNDLGRYLGMQVRGILVIIGMLAVGLLALYAGFRWAGGTLVGAVVLYLLFRPRTYGASFLGRENEIRRIGRTAHPEDRIRLSGGTLTVTRRGLAR